MIRDVGESPVSANPRWSEDNRRIFDNRGRAARVVRLALLHRVDTDGIQDTTNAEEERADGQRHDSDTCCRTGAS